MNIKEITLESCQDVIILFDKYRQFYRQKSDIEGAGKFLRARLKNKESVIFCLYIEDKAVGFTQLYPNFSSVSMTKRWILNDLFVDEKYRKLGVGKALIEHVLKFANLENVSVVRLSTEKTNKKAQKLYEELGFQIFTDSDFINYQLKI